MDPYNVTVISCSHLVRVFLRRVLSFAFVYIGYLARCMRPLFLCFYLLELELINLQLQLAARDCMTVYLTTITDAHSE